MSAEQEEFIAVAQEPDPIPEVPMATRIRWAAEARIKRFYPEYKQLNILMAQDEVEIVKMRSFIEAVRDWSNGSSPDLAVVETISP